MRPRRPQYAGVRDAILRSPFPVLVAIICFVMIAYLARLRRDRFLAYWASAWALLVTRYVWNLIWGSPWPMPWTSSVAAVLRIGFGVALLAGGLEMMGHRVRWWWVAALAIVLPWATDLVGTLVPALHVPTVNGAIAMVLLVLAAWPFATRRDLPLAERSLATAALVTYGLISLVSPLIADGSPWLLVVSQASWVSQLVLAFAMAATYFRVAYDAELREQRRMGETLTQALSGFLSICAHCKAVRNEQGDWERIDHYVSRRSEAVFSHGICERCLREHFGEPDGGPEARPAAERAP